MSQQSHTPESVVITPRNREHEIAECLARDWFDDHPFKTAWFNAMSITFPLGEKFFIDSVRHYADRIEDPKLQGEIRDFCGQEGFHRREHDRYNHELCRRRGYDIDYLEGRLEKNIARAKRMLSPLEQLASTAALEHITAIMAESRSGCIGRRQGQGSLPSPVTPTYADLMVILEPNLHIITPRQGQGDPEPGHRNSLSFDDEPRPAGEEGALPDR